MSNLNTDTVIIPAGGRYEKVFLNAASLHLHFVQEAGSALKLHILYLGEKDGQSTASVTVEQRGKDCTTEIYGLAFLHADETVKLDTNVQHLVGGGKSTQLLKFVLDDASQGEFFGRLLIAPDAQKTEAHQTNRNLLLSDKALMRTRPQLEIYADDVKATHGATTGQLDESALFYMQQRCLAPETARELLIAAFMKDVLETVSDEQMREKLLRMVEPAIAEE